MIRVALVDDHAALRNALAFMLGREPDLVVVGQAGSLAEARSLVATSAIDVALVDLALPDGDGRELLPLLRATSADPAVVVLSGSTRPESAALAVAAGAVGYLPKTVSAAELVSAIRRVACGETLFTVAEALALERQAVQYVARTQAVEVALDRLTPRERDVLRALAAGLGNQEIADRLYLSTATTRTHVRSILSKLGVASRLQAALLAVRHGVVDPDDAH